VREQPRHADDAFPVARERDVLRLLERPAQRLRRAAVVEVVRCEVGLRLRPVDAVAGRVEGDAQKSSPRKLGATGPVRICENRITVTTSSAPTSRLYSCERNCAISSVRRISGLSCSISRGDSSPSVFTSTLSMTASKTNSRALKRLPHSTFTTMPFLYFPDLSPRRMVADLRPVRSWSATMGEEK